MYIDVCIGSANDVDSCIYDMDMSDICFIDHLYVLVMMMMMMMMMMMKQKVLHAPWPVRVLDVAWALRPPRPVKQMRIPLCIYTCL